MPNPSSLHICTPSKELTRRGDGTGTPDRPLSSCLGMQLRPQGLEPERTFSGPTLVILRPVVPGSSGEKRVPLLSSSVIARGKETHVFQRIGTKVALTRG